MTLNELLNNNLLEELFDFEYEWSDVPREYDFTKGKLQGLFKQHYKYWVVIEEDFDMFRYYLSMLWNKHIYTFNRMLKADIDKYVLTNKKKTQKIDIESKQDYSDTPNQQMTNEEVDGYLTDRTLNDSSTTNEHSEEINPLIQLNKLQKLNVTDIVYDFLEKFVDLFDTSYVVSKPLFRNREKLSIDIEFGDTYY